MNRLCALLMMAALGGCVTLPGSESGPLKRYALRSDQASCTRGDTILSLSVVEVAAGLDTDRVARMNQQTGEITYLKGVRWVDNAGPMLEQRLAADLECHGFTVQTGHRTRLAHSQLQCEVRALNLVQQGTSYRAEMGLSCLFYRPGGPEAAVIENNPVALARWSIPEAMAALSLAYTKTASKLFESIDHYTE